MKAWMVLAAAAALAVLALWLRRQAVRRAQRRAGRAAEEAVEALLRRWVRRRRGWHLVERDCSGPYSDRCILLLPPRSQAPQELDHVLVGPAGVVAVETKNYGGVIQVVSDDVWRRGRRGERLRKTESPAAQVRRHESVLRAVLPPGVPVYSVVCIANDGAELRDRRRSRLPVVTAAELPRWLDRLSRRLSPAEAEAAYRAVQRAKKR